ncbi:S8 family serine peptidase [Marinicella meishanensis]|uniref:S8 family serine peptidase n=1 Tax=Marinicella meishanensis TaxID=2873263 RepID=UPI001CBB19BD|nr:S8 family serine peptidase [Marinicella sp. NBU2979]
MKKTLAVGMMMGSLAGQAADWQDKVSGKLLSQIHGDGEVELILRLHSPPLTQPTSQDRIEKINQVINQLQSVAKTSQQPLLDHLKAQGIPFQSFWISNDVLITAPAAKIPAILAFDSVAKAFSNEPIAMDLPQPGSPTATAVDSPTAIEWNVNMVNAPDVWALGHTGQNVVVAGQDTGYDWEHPALINKYRGWDGQNADHNYNWHDSIGSPTVVCGNEPCDDHSHGSHTMGTVLGDDGNGNQIGVAPDARWIGCRNMNVGDGTPATYTECFQWFLAPTDLTDNNPNPAMAPHIINNSWGCPSSEGCTDPAVLMPVVENVVAAGILVVTSAGNSGSGCNSVSTPAAIYDASFTVGSTTSGDEIAFSSSRGNVTVDGSGRPKPDITAPGASVRSANNSGGYSTFSGTSMASPNVAGVAALLISAKPELGGNPKLLEHIMTRTAVPKTTNQSCGGIPGSAVPNNTYGHGRIDALAAVNYALDLIFITDFE